MRQVRVFSQAPLRANVSVELDDGAARHVSQVLRMKAGQELVLFDGRGGEYPAVIESAARNRLTAVTGEHQPTERESPLRLTLWHGLCRGERMDTVIQKATELGAQSLVPIVTERSVVKLSSDRVEKKLRHWHSVVVSACEQCGRNRLPEISTPVDFANALADVRSYDYALLLDPRGEESLASVLGDASETSQVLICTGPEGGFSDAERQAAVAAGMRPVRVGRRVLRTETAPIVALSIAQLLAGDMG
jgi:16S rRNA (uracil1498-N3)-methyltransferase